MCIVEAKRGKEARVAGALTYEYMCDLPYGGNGGERMM